VAGTGDAADAPEAVGLLPAGEPYVGGALEVGLERELGALPRGIEAVGAEVGAGGKRALGREARGQGSATGTLNRVDRAEVEREHLRVEVRWGRSQLVCRSAPTFCADATSKKAASAMATTTRRASS